MTSPAPPTIVQRLEDIYKKLVPWAALITGVGTLLLIRRGVSFAPLALVVLLVAWALASAVVRWLAEREGEGKLRRFLRKAAISFVAGLYQDVLFFLLPLWFGSASFSSINVIVPLLLSVMAVYTCFEDRYYKTILERSVARTAFSSAVLFAALLTSIPVMVHLPLVASVGAAAALSLVLGAATSIPLERLKSGRVWAQIGSAALLVAFLFFVAAPLLPPVPVQCVKKEIARRVEQKEPVEPIDEIDRGSGRVYAWFAVAAPERYPEAVEFRWYKDGELFGRPYETKIVGGRREGFRTWAYQTDPPPGAWRVDLLTGYGQLIGRASFTVR